MIAIIPVYMTEAWMLADKELFKKELGTDKSDRALGIDKKPETIRDPKDTIKQAIRIAFDHLPKRRNRPKIEELYQPIGAKIRLQKLATLPSFQRFKEELQSNSECLIKRLE